MICCGILASVTSEALFGDMVGYLTGHLENPESGDSVESLVACVGQVSALSRLGTQQGGSFAPLVLRHALLGSTLLVKPNPPSLPFPPFPPCASQVSRYVGFRLGPHLASLFPLILAQSGDSSSREQTEEQISTAENCIKTFQSFVIRCPSEVYCLLMAMPAMS